MTAESESTPRVKTQGRECHNQAAHESGLHLASSFSLLMGPGPALGQVRDCVGVLGEARIWIHLPTWRAWDRELTVTSACDPCRPLSGGRASILRAQAGDETLSSGFLCGHALSLPLPGACGRRGCALNSVPVQTSRLGVLQMYKTATLAIMTEENDRYDRFTAFFLKSSRKRKL